MTVSIDLGSGPVPKNPFGADKAYGIDIVDYPGVIMSDIAKDGIDQHFVPWADYIVCTDFLEHIPRTGFRLEHGFYSTDLPRLKPYNPFIFVMSEVYRALKPGGIFQAKTPAWPHPEAFQDPTHVNVITEKTVEYFHVDGMLELGHAYGFEGGFNLLDQYWDTQVPYWLVWELQKP